MTRDRVELRAARPLQLAPTMKKIKKLGFSTETVRNLAPATLTQVGGGGPYTINITCDASGCGCVPTRMYTCRCPTAATC